MKDSFKGEEVLDFETIKSFVSQQIPLEIYIDKLPPKIKENLRNTMVNFLKACDLDFLDKYFDYCLNELLENANKANFKRVFFKSRNLNIEDLNDYEVGMKDFRDAFLGYQNEYLDAQIKAGYYIKLIFLFKDDVLTISIRNNSLPTKIEKQRIKDKLDNVHQYTPEELMGDVIDQTEGAGIGINSVCLILQKMGLDLTAFSITEEGNETNCQLVCPYDILVPSL